VGQLSAGIFGYRNPATLDYAEALGIAFQLTNIIRDVGEDARRDRVYLPQEDLARFGLEAGDIIARRDGEPFRNLMAFQADRARSYYELAESKLAAANTAARSSTTASISSSARIARRSPSCAKSAFRSERSCACRSRSSFRPASRSARRAFPPRSISSPRWPPARASPGASASPP